MKKRFKILSLIITVYAMAFISGCIRDDNNDGCVQSLSIHFYSRTMCQTEIVYPEAVNDLLMCVFNGNGVLVEYRQMNGITLGPEYVETVEVSTSGIYYVLAWSGLDGSSFDINELEVGGTRKDDLLFRLKRAQTEASPIGSGGIYSGESPAALVTVTKNPDAETIQARVNMQEVTNRITVQVEGLNLNDINDYEIDIESNSGSMNIDGSIAADDVIKYDRAIFDDSGVLTAYFTVLKLETGYNNTLVIRDKSNNKELFRGSLLGALILKNPEVNLNCDHDFTIKFTTEDECECGTYMIVDIRVNNWPVSSYNTDM